MDIEIFSRKKNLGLSPFLKFLQSFTLGAIQPPFRAAIRDCLKTGNNIQDLESERSHNAITSDNQICRITETSAMFVTASQELKAHKQNQFQVQNPKQMNQLPKQMRKREAVFPKATQIYINRIE